MSVETLPAEMGFREFAEFRRWRPSYVTQLRREGRLVLTDDRKRVRVAESLHLIEQTADPARYGVAERHSAKRGPSEAPPPSDQDGQGGDADDDFDPAAGPTGSHQLRRAKALADKAETDAMAAARDYQLSMGKLLAVDDVEAAVRSALAAFRTALENFGGKYAPELAAAHDEARIRTLLNDAIETELTELHRKFALIAKADT